MSVEATIAELRVRLSLTQGSASLLLVVCPTDVVLAESHALLLAALRATPMTVVDLGVCAGDEGPERWAARTRASAGEAYLLTIPDRAPLAMRGFAQLLNAQRQLLHRAVVLGAPFGRERVDREHRVRDDELDRAAHDAVFVRLERHVLFHGDGGLCIGRRRRVRRDPGLSARRRPHRGGAGARARGASR